MDLAPDFDEFIESLIAHGAEFLIVGAYALAFHGAPRFTGDLDILIRPTGENITRVLAAIRAFGFPTSPTRIEKDPKRRWQAVGDLRTELEAMAAAPWQLEALVAGAVEELKAKVPTR